MTVHADRPTDVLDSHAVAAVTAPAAATTDAAPAQPATARPQRDRYIDSLRVVALVRVMTYHAFGWAWLPLLFPSMGIMFALAGSLVAASLDRSPGNPWRVLRKRVVRLLPPVWLLGAVLVPVMLVAGWTWSATAGSPLHVRTLLLWLLPVSDPPGSALGEDWVLPLWYVRTYLWFLLLSPMALWLFRHWPKRMLVLPAAVVVLWTVGVLPLDGRTGDVLLSLATFGGCWLLGFAHHDGRIRRLPAPAVLAGGAALMALGVAYAVTHPDPASGWDIDNIPLADMLYCLGAVLVLLRLYPDFSWMARHRVVDTFVVVVNSRAMTIYLWGNVAIYLSHPVLDRWSVTAGLDQDTWVGALQAYLASWVILGVCVLAFGWCEDLAARRPVRFNPWPTAPGRLAALRTLRPFVVPAGARSVRLTPQRLALATAGLVVGAAVLATLSLVGTRTPARTVAGDAQSRDALVPRPEVSRSLPPVPGAAVTRPPASGPTSVGVVPQGPRPDGGAGVAPGTVPGVGGPAGAGGGAVPARPQGVPTRSTTPRPSAPAPSAPAPAGSPTSAPSSPPATTPAPQPTGTPPPPAPTTDPPPPDPTPTGTPSAPAADPGGGPAPTGGLVGTVGDVVGDVVGTVLP